MKDYKAMIDYIALEEVGLKITQAPKCPWQFFIRHPDYEVKFIYYPSTGALVNENIKNKPNRFNINSTEELIEKIYSLHYE